MRQLDFFASLFESETAEKPAERNSVRKNEVASLSKRNGPSAEQPELIKQPVTFSLFDSAAIPEQEMPTLFALENPTFEIGEEESTEVLHGETVDASQSLELEPKTVEDKIEKGFAYSPASSEPNSVVALAEELIEKEEHVIETLATVEILDNQEIAIRKEEIHAIESPELSLFFEDKEAVPENAKTDLSISVNRLSENELAPPSPRKPKGSEIFNDGKISVRMKSKPEAAKDEKVPEIVSVPEEKATSPVTVETRKKIKTGVQLDTAGIPVVKEKIKKVPQKRGRKSFKEIDAEVDLIEVPDDEILFKKQYYPISIVAKWFLVNTSLLRFWENEFDVLKPRKNRKGDRLFRPEDVKNLQLIYHLLRQRKYTIEGAKEYLKTHKKKADMQMQLTNTLQKFKGFLLELRANLQQ